MWTWQRERARRDGTAVGRRGRANVRRGDKREERAGTYERTSSMNSTPGTSSATPWSMYLLTTRLISVRSFSVT
jgi:hypothetical protein